MATKKKTPHKTKPKKAVKKKVSKNKAKPKIAGEFAADSPEAKQIYRRRYYLNHTEQILSSQKAADAAKAEKERQEFMKHIKKKYNF